MTTQVRESLNLRTVEVVSPKCFRGRFSYLDREGPYKKCLKCEFIDGDNIHCAYEEYRADTTRGTFEDSEGDDIYFVHFNCATCGELIEVHGRLSWIDNELRKAECKHCGTPHVMIRDNHLIDKYREVEMRDNYIIFAVPVNFKKKYPRENLHAVQR